MMRDIIPVGSYVLIKDYPDILPQSYKQHIVLEIDSASLYTIPRDTVLAKSARYTCTKIRMVEKRVDGGWENFIEHRVHNYKINVVDGLCPWREALSTGDIVKYCANGQVYDCHVISRESSNLKIQPVGSKCFIASNINADSILSRLTKYETSYWKLKPFEIQKHAHKYVGGFINRKNSHLIMGDVVGFDEVAKCYLTRPVTLEDHDAGPTWRSEKEMEEQYVPVVPSVQQFPWNYEQSKPHTDFIADLKFDVSSIKRASNLLYPPERWEKMIGDGDSDLILADIEMNFRLIETLAGEGRVYDESMQGLKSLLSIRYNASNWIPLRKYNPCITDYNVGAGLVNDQGIRELWTKLHSYCVSIGLTSYANQLRAYLDMNQETFKQVGKGVALEYFLSHPKIFDFRIKEVQSDLSNKWLVISINFPYKSMCFLGRDVLYHGDINVRLEKLITKHSNMKHVGNVLELVYPTPRIERVFKVPYETLEYINEWNTNSAYYTENKILAPRSLLGNGTNCLSSTRNYTVLYDYQRIALEFMIKKEREGSVPISHTLERGPHANALVGLHYKNIPTSYGGFLSLEMGLGKTVVTVCLMHALRKKTLVVVPLTIIDQWKKEIETFWHGTPPKITYYYGKRKDASGDIVLTTYGVVRHAGANIFSNPKINFERVIFDESHCVKTVDSNLCMYSSAIDAKYRWCLTATPFDNNDVTNIAPQLSMLRIYPFGYNGFRNYLKTVVQDYYENIPRYGRMVQLMIKETMFVQTKVGLQKYRKQYVLNEPTVETIEVINSEIENGMFQQMREVIRKRIESLYTNGNGSIYRHYGVILKYMETLSSTLTHICCADLWEYATRQDSSSMSVQNVVSMLDDNANKYQGEVKKQLQELFKDDVRQQCPICLETIKHPCVTNPCFHLFCKDCIAQSLTHRSACPNCRQQVTNTFEVVAKNDMTVEGEDVIFTDTFGFQRVVPKCIFEHYKSMEDLKTPSTKIKKLLECVEKILGSSDHSIVIFSQYRGVLMMVKHFFELNGIIPNILVGSKSRHQRKEAIHKFKTNKKSVILLSTKCAGVGLTLTCACHLFFMEPIMDKNVEKQAIGRLVRLGQQNIVSIYNLMVKDSIDAEIMNLRQRESEKGKRCNTSVMRKIKTNHVLKIFGF